MKKLLLPAIRGHIGDWIFYSCIMSLTEIGSRVRYADEVHNNERLSDMIQRELRASRAKEIASYLHENEQRFFNSLVLAVYDTDPTWYEVGRVEGAHRYIDIEPIADRVNSLGVLELSPSLEIFAIDGQHRLSGIKLLMEREQASPEDQLPVVLVGHKKTAEGLERTRRLFTTLNKYAKKVSKGETISLDEDDAAAIVVRRLVEKHRYFSGARIAYRPTNNLPKSNLESLTTIGNLYDVVWVVLSKLSPPSSKLNKRLRPSDTTLEECEGLVVQYFESLARRFPALQAFFEANDPAAVVREQRGDLGGHILFRPVGLSIFTELTAESLAQEGELETALDLVAALPTELSRRPYLGTLWDGGRGVMRLKGRTILRDLLRRSLGLPVKEGELRERLARWIESPETAVVLDDWVSGE